MRFHHPGTSHRQPKWRWSACYISYTRSVEVSDQAQRAFSRILRKSEAIILAFPWTYFPEQGFWQVLHTRSEYCNHLDMYKIWETPNDLNQGFSTGPLSPLGGHGMIHRRPRVEAFTKLLCRDNAIPYWWAGGYECWKSLEGGHKLT